MAKPLDSESQIRARLKLRDLRVFTAVVQHGSMAKAARQLGISQPAVSETIADLEHALGARLLDRGANGVAATIYGEALLNRSMAAFDELRQAVRDIEFLSNPSKGELRIGCTETISATILPQIVARFSQQNPGVTVHCDDVGGRATEVLGPGLRERKYDCVMQRVVLPLPTDLADDLNVEVLHPDDLVVAAGSQTVWARRRKIQLSELMGEPWILPRPGTWYHNHVAKLFRVRGLEVPRASMVTHSVALRTRLLTEGQYLTTFARSVVRLNSARYGLTVLAIGPPSEPLPAGILTLKNRTLSPVVQRFLGIARELAKSFAGDAAPGARLSLGAKRNQGRSP
jgi:DNA-binding transcriptional LysR family regulator